MADSTLAKVYYDPYDIGITADPYPTYARLRDEAPLYYNERYDFWALSRHTDVEKARVGHRLRHRPAGADVDGARLGTPARPGELTQQAYAAPMSWWMDRSEHTLAEMVPAEPAVVQAFYADLNNLAHLHPLIVSVRSVSRVDSAHSYLQTYRVRDRIPLGPVTLPISYQTQLWVGRGDGEPRIDAEARQFPWIKLRSTLHFNPDPAGTRLIEHLTITAPRPLATVTSREALAAHTELLAGIRRIFEKRL